MIVVWPDGVMVQSLPGDTEVAGFSAGVQRCFFPERPENLKICRSLMADGHEIIVSASKSGFVGQERLSIVSGVKTEYQISPFFRPFLKSWCKITQTDCCADSRNGHDVPGMDA